MVAGPFIQFIDRDNPGVLQLTGYAGLPEESGTDRGVAGVLGPEFLESDMSSEVAISGGSGRPLSRGCR
jgi:hypothetical protein